MQLLHSCVTSFVALSAFRSGAIAGDRRGESVMIRGNAFSDRPAGSVVRRRSTHRVLHADGSR